MPYFLLGAIAKLSVVVIAAYVLLSFISALRMYFIHSRYVHIEFSPKTWEGYGKWAPRRLRLLIRMRWLAITALLLCIATVGASVFISA